MNPTMSGINLNPRDVVWINFQFSGQEPKKRPALIISNDINIQNSEFVIVLPITTSSVPDAYSVPITDSNFEGNSLNRKSSVVCDVIMTLSKSEYKGHVGKVKKEFFNSIMQKIKDDSLQMNGVS